MKSQQWSENVILADAGFLDSLTFEMTVYFERILDRRIPKADLARWVDCIALDGGLLPGDNKTQVILLHKAEKTALQNFVPSTFQGDIDGQAFNDSLGEFTLHTATPEGLASMKDFFVQSFELLSHATDVKRIIAAPDMQEYCSTILQAAAKAQEKDVTLLVGNPQGSWNFKQEKIAYSIMTALGIRGEELA